MRGILICINAARLLSGEEAAAARIAAAQSGAATGQSRSSEARRSYLQDYEARRLASTAFLRAGGTRGEFERAWPQLISDTTQRRAP